MTGPALACPAAARPATIPEAIARAATVFAGHGITVRDRTGRSGERRTFAALADNVGAAAAAWRRQGVETGARILIALPTSWEFITAWLGAIHCGAQPAAIAPLAGDLTAGGTALARLERHRAVIDATHFLAPGPTVEQLRRTQPDGLGRIALSPGELATGADGAGKPAAAAPDDVAFLQFTSGSTGTPRAVMVRHRMAIHNALALNETLQGPQGEPAAECIDVSVSWLPLHHDMGLIGCLLFPLVAGFDLDLMNPQTFLGRPLRYLEALHGRRAATAAPNFGYQYCVDRLTPADLAGIDLAHLRFALCGSEMIRPETMAAFTALVAGTGFRPEVIRPCYGMAEATLAVTFDRRDRGPRARSVPAQSSLVLEAQSVICVGAPVPDTEVRVVGSGGATMVEDEVGEIWARGPAVLQGYHADPAATAQTLADGWLRTGDLGFVHAGELYIAGRRKEILVIRGENLMPHEIEWLAEEARGAQAGAGERSAAFAVSRDGPGEEIVLVVETSETDPAALHALDHAIRSRIGRGLSLPVGDLVLVRRGRLPRTSSGKIQRGRIREDYLRGSIERLAPARAGEA